jgi:hypothetical protein
LVVGEVFKVVKLDSGAIRFTEMLKRSLDVG